MLDPYTIMVAPNGARRTKADHPALPITQAEIVDAVAQAHEAGAQAAHVHVRDEDGNHVLDSERYLSLTEALRARCGETLTIQITTEAVGRYTPQQQRDLVHAVQPQAVSIAYRELFADAADNAANADFLSWAKELGVSIQWIVYEPHEVDALASLLAQGVAPSASPMLFVLGRYTKGQQSTPADLLPFLERRDASPALQSERWSVCAFGSSETQCLLAALLLGGDIRIGFENSLWQADGTVATSNADRVREIVQLATALRLKPAP